MKTKADITYVLIKVLNIDTSKPKQSHSDLLFSWWATGRNDRSMRLSDTGKQAFDLAQIEFYDFPIDVTKSNFPVFVLELGKKIKCPFYVGFNNRLYKSAYIRLYDSKIAMLATLYGNISEYLNSTK
jgi:hypothetical protein